MLKTFRVITIISILSLVIIVLPNSLTDETLNIEAEPDYLSVSLGDGESIVEEFVIYNKNNYTVNGTLEAINAQCYCGYSKIFIDENNKTVVEEISIPANGSLTIRVEIYGRSLYPWGGTSTTWLEFNETTIVIIRVYTSFNLICIISFVILIVIIATIVIYLKKRSKKKK